MDKGFGCLVRLFVLAVFVLMLGCFEALVTSASKQKNPLNESTELSWPQWRGPTGMGLTNELNLPVVWSQDSANIRWRRELPCAGNSSPIVHRDLVYFTDVCSDRKDIPAERAAVAVDFESGKIVWRTMVVRTTLEARHSMNTNASPTPVTDGEHLFVYFGSHLAALDLAGQLLWVREVETDYHRYSRYAASSSPILTAQSIIVAQDQESGNTDDVGWLAAFDKATGRRLWRVEWDETCCSYSTPLLVGEGARQRLLFARSGILSEYDPETGAELWSHQYKINQMVSSLVAEDDLLCIAGGAHNVRLATCLRLVGRGRETQVEVLWESVQGPPETSSPVLHDGRLFMVTSKGILSCIDAESGERHWRKRLAQQGYHVSLLAGDGKLYVPNARGLTTVLALDAGGPRILAENQLDQGGNASPAIVDGSLLLRTRQQLIRISGTDSL